MEVRMQNPPQSTGWDGDGEGDLVTPVDLAEVMPLLEVGMMAINSSESPLFGNRNPSLSPEPTGKSIFLS